MQYKWKKFNLQFFGGEGASAGGDGAGEGTSTGVSQATDTVAAGQEKTLESLGVPKARLERYNRAKGRSAKVDGDTGTDQKADTAAPKQNAETVQRDADASEQEKPKRDYDAEWKTLMEDPEFKKRHDQETSDTVVKRVKNMKGQLEGYEALEPALKLLTKKYGVTEGDLKALSAAITDDDTYYEDDAIAMNTDTETAKRTLQREAEVERRERQVNESLKDQMLHRHFDDLRRQGDELAQKIPGFNLSNEMQNERFVRMTRPEGGFSVEEAYYALHHKEIERQRINETAHKTAQALSNSIQAGRNMPTENGSQTRAASNVQPKPYSQMSKQERAEFKRRLQTNGR